MKIVKKVISIVLSIMIVLCSAAIITLATDHLMNHLKTASFAETNFKQLTFNSYLDLYVDLETNVMYVRTSTGTLTAMINADGSPKLYTHEYK